MKICRLRANSRLRSRSPGDLPLAALGDMRWQVAVHVDQAAADDRPVRIGRPVEQRADMAVGEIGEAVVVLHRVGAGACLVVGVEQVGLAQLAAEPALDQRRDLARAGQRQLDERGVARLHPAVRDLVEHVVGMGLERVELAPRLLRPARVSEATSPNSTSPASSLATSLSARSVQSAIASERSRNWCTSAAISVSASRKRIDVPGRFCARWRCWP